MPVKKIGLLVDEKGLKKSVVLPIKEDQALVEYLPDLAVIAEQTGEPDKRLAMMEKNLAGKKWLNTIS